MMATKKRDRPRAYPEPKDAGASLTTTEPITKRHKVVVMPAKVRDAEERQQELRQMEDELLAKSTSIMATALNFASVPFDTKEVPEDLVEIHGREKAEEMFRLMKSAQQSAKDAPVGLLLAQRVNASIIKARASEKSKPAALNVGIQVVVSQPQFEEREIE